VTKTLYWTKGRLYLLDQKALPHKTVYVRCVTSGDVARAIKHMTVRGAPAIGITAAFGVVLAAGEKRFRSGKELYGYLRPVMEKLGATRPTAVNLFWALRRMEGRLKESVARGDTVEGIRKELENEASKILSEDIAQNRRISVFGSALLKKGSSVITHCNAGALATGGEGTALGVIKEAHRKNRIKLVYVDETRPYLQGARLTAWELRNAKVPYLLICDNMAGHIMKTEKVDAVIVGADRIAANGDAANKIGTYSLAILADYHNIPFYVAAPQSSVDAGIGSGREIKIEERPGEEVTSVCGREIAPKGTIARHPAFDVTPAKLITAIITDRGVFRRPYRFVG
jgi:methylthioribose-1-phosphate isomerase